MGTGKPELLLEGLVFGEGPRWRGGRLWFSDMYGEAVHAVDAAGHLETVVRLPGRHPSGLGFLPDGSLLVVSMHERQVLRWNGKGLSVHADLATLVRDPCNDMVVDTRGHAWVGTFPPLATPAEGVLVHVAPDGAARIAATEMRFPNGSVVTPDGGSLIVAESLGRRFTRFTIRADGALDARGVFAECAPLGPDGICLDQSGAIWAAFPLAREFRRIAPGGEPLERIPMGDRLAIACALGGTRGRTLFMLTALEHSPEALRGTRGAAIHVVDVEIPGTGSP